MMWDNGQAGVKNITEGLREKKFSAMELCRHTLSAIENDSRNLNSFITVTEKTALERAEKIDREISLSEDPGPLAGVPVSIKDNVCLQGYPTTCASKVLENFIPPYDATCVRRLLDAGAVIVGKNNMDEFAMGSSNETSYFGPSLNPHGNQLVPGGSSGGSAAAVAAGLVPLALGSDTGGSVRQPAAFCGIYGLKPTYGAVSRYGLVAFASSMDQIGPMARSVNDLAILFSVINGHDSHDATSAGYKYPDIVGNLESDRKYKIGLPSSLFRQGIDAEIMGIFEKAGSDLQNDGHQLVEIELPHVDLAIAVYYVIANAEASSNLARYDGVNFGLRVDGINLDSMMHRARSEGFGREVKRRIILGTHVLSAGYCEAYYNHASRIRGMIRNDLDTAFNEVDIIMMPTTPTAAFKIGEKTDNPLEMYLSDIFTVPANLAGIPAISVPYGSAADGRPAGIQFMARGFDELSLFQIARRCERITGE